MVRGPTTARGAQEELVEASRDDLHRTHIALLAQSRSGAVREAVAKRDDVPFGVQAALSNDDAHDVRAAIAGNPRAAISVMHHLAEDSHHAVLLALAIEPERAARGGGKARESPAGRCPQRCNTPTREA